ncbi:amidohydrolase [Aureispira anguillae]|uniref:Omega-amidase YafV n=1 Tax=Aureispira anguillae TaxID=2864201 RepID=A0A915YDG2_9BACT|nr:amidohydrolase [Aureispira anguillae]BDS11053.1 amidohydrolase [Aureispira anguillae]
MSLTITLIQSTLHWEDSTANLRMFDEKLSNLKNTDLVILPEMFTTGFSMDAPNLAEEMSNSPTIRWMHQKAQEINAAVTGSLIIKENEAYYNRLIWVAPNGEQLHYDKKHLFSMAKEHLTFTAGTQKLIIDYKGWKIMPFICYDLRFPAWNRNLEDCDLIFYVANWPAKRSFHWRSLLTARAIENQAYVVGVNCTGFDGNGFAYSGDSSVFDPAGELLFHQADEEAIYTLTLTKEHLNAMRKKYPFLADKDHYVL